MMILQAQIFRSASSFREVVTILVAALGPVMEVVADLESTLLKLPPLGVEVERSEMEPNRFFYIKSIFTLKCSSTIGYFHVLLA